MLGVLQQLLLSTMLGVLAAVASEKAKEAIRKHVPRMPTAIQPHVEGMFAAKEHEIHQEISVMETSAIRSATFPAQMTSESRK